MPRVPTVDDVLAAIPRCESPARVVVRAAELYLTPTARRPASLRAVAAEVGVHKSTAERWMRALGLTRTMPQALAVHHNRQRVRSGRRAVDWAAVRADYAAGVPVRRICERHGVLVDRVYGALRRAGVPLRRGAPGQPTARQRGASERRERARELAAEMGVGYGDRAGKRLIAQQLGVSERSVRNYLRTS